MPIEKMYCICPHREDAIIVSDSSHHYNSLVRSRFHLSDNPGQWNSWSVLSWHEQSFQYHLKAWEWETGVFGNGLLVSTVLSFTLNFILEEMSQNAVNLDFVQRGDLIFVMERAKHFKVQCSISNFVLNHNDVLAFLAHLRSDDNYFDSIGATNSLQ